MAGLKRVTKTSPLKSAARATLSTCSDICRVCWQLYSYFHILTLVGILILMSLVGGVIFLSVEHPKELKLKTRIESSKRLFMNNLIAHAEDELITTELVRFQEDFLIKEIEDGARFVDGNFTDSWTLENSILFCMTTFTCVGYGSPAPTSAIGRILTVLYAGVTIPLATNILQDIGDMMVSSCSFLWLAVLEVLESCKYRLARLCRRSRKVKARDRLAQLRKNNNNYNHNCGRRSVLSAPASGDVEMASMVDQGNYKRKKHSHGWDSGAYRKGQHKRVSIRNREAIKKRLGFYATRYLPFAFCIIVGKFIWDKARKLFGYTSVPNQMPEDTNNCAAENENDATADDDEELPKPQKEFEVHPLVNALILVGYIMGGAAVISRLSSRRTFYPVIDRTTGFIKPKKLSFLACCWFVFISLTTAGYGDVVPDQQLHVWTLPYLFIGLCLTQNLITAFLPTYFADIVNTVRGTMQVTEDWMANRRATQLVEVKRRRARRRWRMIRKHVDAGTIPRALIDGKAAYQNELMQKEKEFVRNAYRIYFYEVFKEKARKQIDAGRGKVGKGTKTADKPSEPTSEPTTKSSIWQSLKDVSKRTASRTRDVFWPKRRWNKDELDRLHRQVQENRRLERQRRPQFKPWVANPSHRRVRITKFGFTRENEHDNPKSRRVFKF